MHDSVHKAPAAAGPVARTGRIPVSAARLKFPLSAALFALWCGLLLGVGLGGAGLSPCAAAAGTEQSESVALGDFPGLSYEIYQVHSGDTVQNIAARFGISPDEIRALNGLPSSAQPEPGRSLAIPLPQRASPVGGEAGAQPVAQTVEPRYAVVRMSGPITSQPGGGYGSEVFYEPAVGSRLIVTSEQGDYWGVVMIDGSTGWVPKSSLELTDQVLSGETLDMMLRGGRPDVVQEAFRYLGTPYRYGGRLPENVDCSLLVQTVFASRGMQLPRTAQAQYEFGRVVSHYELLPGDRLYFVSKSGRINHTGIYIGGGRFIHASSRHGRVAVDDLSSAIYWSRFMGARRF